MPKPTVYLETSVVGYATSRPSRDLIVAARQQVTREWFDRWAGFYELLVSQLVVREALSGDAAAAELRGELLKGLRLLAVTDSVGELAGRRIRDGAVPKTSADDAVHIAVAAVHGVDYLLTWNFKHIANASIRQAIEEVCDVAGYESPVICTPEELIDEDRG